MRGGYVVRIVDNCAAALTGGYEGCDLEVEVQSLAAAQRLVAALLGGNDAGQLEADVEYACACAGGRRTVILRRRDGCGR